MPARPPPHSDIERSTSRVRASRRRHAAIARSSARHRPATAVACARGGRLARNIAGTSYRRSSSRPGRATRPGGQVRGRSRRGSPRTAPRMRRRPRRTRVAARVRRDRRARRRPCAEARDGDLWRCHPAGDRGALGLGHLEQVPLDAEVPQSAVPARKSSGWARPVVWASSAPMWVPIISGGSSSPSSAGSPAARARRCMSEVQTRSACSRTPRSTRPPPQEHDSISSPGWRRGARRSAGTPRGSARGRRVGRGRVRRRRRRARLWSHLM